MAEEEREGQKEPGAKRRKFWVGAVLAVVGLLLIGYGVFTPGKWPVALLGALLTVVFGLIAAGATRAKFGFGPKGVSAEADFRGLKPPPERESDHR